MSVVRHILIMSKLRFRDSSVLLRVIQRYTRLDSLLSTPGPVPTTLILLMFIFTQLIGIEDLLCAGDSTRSPQWERNKAE